MSDSQNPIKVENITGWEIQPYVPKPVVEGGFSQDNGLLAKLHKILKDVISVSCSFHLLLLGSVHHDTDMNFTIHANNFLSFYFSIAIDVLFKKTGGKKRGWDQRQWCSSSCAHFIPTTGGLCKQKFCHQHGELLHKFSSKLLFDLFSSLGCLT